MQDLFLTNTLSHKKEKFTSLTPGKVGIYSCGPTVYWNQHIGHMYAYTQWDILVRFLKYLKYDVKWVMNITDVGHMTSDEDTGIDKMEKGAKREGLNVWQIADKYIKQFEESLKLLNITNPDIMCRATEHINEQIELIKLIEKNGFTYQTKTGLVFDTAKFPKYADFAGLNLKGQEAGARVEVDKEKKNPWDFLLWVTNQPNHIMQWESPWGKGYPGWHIECTAMSVKYLGERFDIHTGGKEHIPVHHTNEIAQSYGAFNHSTANFWLHNEWLMFDGGKMSKSLGNMVTVQDLVQKGIGPLALRYLFLNSNYRTGLNFTWESLASAEKALENIKSQISSLKSSTKNILLTKKDKKTSFYQEKFLDALADDLNTPKALGVFWEMLKDKDGSLNKYALALSFDKVLGLKLKDISQERFEMPASVKKLLDEREKERRENNFPKADKIRKDIEDLGFIIEDAKDGQKVKPK